MTKLFFSMLVCVGISSPFAAVLAQSATLSDSHLLQSIMNQQINPMSSGNIVVSARDDKKNVSHQENRHQKVTQQNSKKQHVTNQRGNRQYVTHQKSNKQHVTNHRGNRQYVTHQKSNKRYTDSHRSNRYYHSNRYYPSNRYYHDDRRDDNKAWLYTVPFLMQGLFGNQRSTYYYDNNYRHSYTGSYECLVHYRGRSHLGTVNNRNGLCYIYYHNRYLGFSNYR